MRPVRLMIQAFGPFPNREIIDFRDAVETGLFGIYGRTGSGKSTIFSAMTFALFGEPAKAEQDAPSLRSDLAEANVQTEVEFVFDIGARRFVILRRAEQMRPKHRGDGETRNPHEAFLFDATGLALDDIKDGHRGRIVAEKRVRDVDEAVVNVLGYGPEQFRQIVLLPQGRFETFLSAKHAQRIEILRELFDVSLYRTLADTLKTKAAAEERRVRDERDYCARRLADENFESNDALAAGIAEAESLHAVLMDAEKAARTALAFAQSAVQEAEAIEAKFQAAEGAEKALAELLVRQPAMDSLAEQVARAERARSLLDLESNVTAAAHDVRDAEETLKHAQIVAERAEANAATAAEALKAEAGRATEIEDLRRRVDELVRHENVLGKAIAARDELEKAQAAEREAAQTYDEIRRHLTDLQTTWRDQSAAAKAARQTEAHRADITIRLARLKPALTAAETFENATRAVLAAKGEADSLTLEHETNQRGVDAARAAFEQAERRLSEAQALALASRLETGEPCPVCGATEHPAPAAGATEHTQFDQAFREAKAAWQDADKAARAVAQKLAAAQSVLKEREQQLAGLVRPEESATAIRAKIENEERALKSLGREIDLAVAEATADRLRDEIETREAELRARRDALSELQKTTVSQNARLMEMLGAVPEALRDPVVLVAAKGRASQALRDRETAKAAAEKAATDTREAALATRKDAQSSELALASCKERHDKAVEAFRSRLDQAGLSAENFRALKLAIATIDDDRATVEEHRRKLANAKESAKSSAEAIQGLVRPDLQAIDLKRTEADEKLTEAMDQRSRAVHRLDHLRKLRDDLAARLRSLEEAEAASGSLRKLAALVNGENPQKLDLETFAIGAMFDQVLETANLRLGPMTGNRYRLERDVDAGRGRRGLGIQVFDLFTGKARATSTLSGGETFIAALALALGLADVVESANGKVRLDTIFIDEGFGSLDTENGSGTLDQVLQALNSLVSQNRAVGLISHVPLVQEAIPNGFYVRKQLAGSSVETRGLI